MSADGIYLNFMGWVLVRFGNATSETRRKAHTTSRSAIVLHSPRQFFRKMLAE